MKIQSIIRPLAILMASFPGWNMAQSVQPNRSERMEMHSEESNMPYTPNAYNNQRVTPAYRFQSGERSRTTATSVTTVQVNVDASGMNIVGDAANEPSLAIYPINTSQMTIGWRQFDDVNSSFRQAGWAFTTNSGSTWTFPGVIEPGFFRSDPVLDYDNQGVIYYNSLTNTPTYQCKVFRSNNGGGTWDAGVDAAGGDKQWMAVDRLSVAGEGNIYASWTEDYSVCNPQEFTRSFDGGTTYEPCEDVEGAPYWGKLALASNGDLYAGGGGMFDSLQVTKSTNAYVSGSAITWSPTVSVFMDGYLTGWGAINPEGLLGMVNVEVDCSNGPTQNNVYLLASMARISSSDPGDVMFARSTDGGQTWSAPIKINDDVSVTNTQWFGTMSVAPNGRIDAVWLDTREDQFGTDSSALYYSYSLNGGLTWSANEKISDLFDPHVGYPVQLKMGDYFDMISDSVGAHLAWAATFNGEEDVYYSRILPAIPTGLAQPHTYSFSVSPNPSQSIISISSPAEQFQLEIFSSVGDLVYKGQNLSSGIQIDLSGWSKGVYLVRLTASNGSISQQRVVKY